MTLHPLLKTWAYIPANIRGACFVVVGAFLLIIMASLVKHLGNNLPASEVLFVRFLAGLLVITPLVWRGGFEVTRTSKLHLHAARGFLGVLGNLCFFYALINIPFADTITIQFSRPLFMILIAGMFLHETITAKRSLVTIVGFGGVLLITRPFGVGFDPWTLTALGGTCFGTLVVLTIKVLSRTEETVTIMFYTALFTTLLSLVPAIATWYPPTWMEIVLLILTGTLGIVGQGLFTHGIGLGETSFVLPFDYMRIVYAFILGNQWFNENVGWWSYAGTCLIVASSIYLIRTEQSVGK